MDGTPEQKREYLPRVASGELVVSFALTEPDTGSDAASLKTRGVKDGSDYLLNGTKRFITNAPRAGAFTLMARTEGPGAGGITAFIVPAGLPGLTLGKPDRKMGQRGTKTCDVNLDNVRVPADNITPSNTTPSWRRSGSSGCRRSRHPAPRSTEKRAVPWVPTSCAGYPRAILGDA